MICRIFFNYHSLTHRNDPKAGSSRSRRPHNLRRGPVAARIVELRVQIPPWDMDVCLFVNVVCCEVEVSATGRSLAWRTPTDCGVCELDREASTLWRP